MFHITDQFLLLNCHSPTIINCEMWMKICFAFRKLGKYCLLWGNARVLYSFTHRHEIATNIIRCDVHHWGTQWVIHRPVESIRRPICLTEQLSGPITLSISNLLTRKVNESHLLPTSVPFEHIFYWCEWHPLASPISRYVFKKQSADYSPVLINLSIVVYLWATIQLIPCRWLKETN